MCKQRLRSRSGHERCLPERAALQFWSSEVVPAAQKTVISPPRLLISNTEFKGRRESPQHLLGTSPARTRDDRPMDTDVSDLQLFI